MKNYLVIGFRFGVYTTMVIKTTIECVEMRAIEKGFNEICRIEEA